MTCRSLRRRAPFLVATLLAALLVAAPAAAYVIYLTDGSKIIAQGPYQVRDGKAHIVLQNGTRTFLDAAEIDVARTTEANRSNLGSALVIEGGEAVEARPEAPAPKPTLRDLVQRAPAPPQRAPRESGSGSAAAVPRTASGHLDLAALPRRPLATQELATQIVEMFGEHELQPIQVTSGSAGGRVLIEATTSSEAAVFRTLAVAASSLVRLRQQGAELAAVELLLTTPGGERAGQFLLTPELAEELLEGRVDVATFFLAQVQV
ncbi:MAG TPA: hypothetical protein VM617_03800 [Thermoanaerobaculia bacterium]|nr:hypothetical protein [Thermoanaerobaculia bacterium]